VYGAGVGGAAASPFVSGLLDGSVVFSPCLPSNDLVVLFSIIVVRVNY
jgi:hypothetical protein